MSWTSRTSTTTSWDARIAEQGFLLKEDGFHLLQENGNLIILDDGSILTNWTARAAL